jgi:hypothetical protein
MLLLEDPFEIAERCFRDTGKEEELGRCLLVAKQGSRI